MGKEKVICDSDVMIDYLDKKRSRNIATVDLIGRIGLDNVSISAITKMELIAGAANKTEQIAITANINYFDTLIINEDITLIAVQLMEKYRLSHGLAIPDAIIAATSLFTGFPLYTYNLKDFRYIDKLDLFKY